MRTYIHEVNPAAVLGYNLPRIYLQDSATSPKQELEVEAYRGHNGSGNRDVKIHFKDQAFLDMLEAAPGFEKMSIGHWGERPHCFGICAYRASYDQTLALLSTLYRVGYRFDSELANQQVAAVLNGVPLPAQAAYAQFTATAEDFLRKVQSLNLVALTSRKGIRQLEHPIRGIGLMQDSASIRVTPDPYRERYVHVTIRGCLFTEDVLVLRELAYDHYESLGQRVQLIET